MSTNYEDRGRRYNNNDDDFDRGRSPQGRGGRRMRVNDRIIRYITVRVDEDRRRAEKFRAKRARKAEKRTTAQEGRKQGAAPAQRPAVPEAEEDAA